MKAVEVLLIAILSTASALIAWLVIDLYTAWKFFESYYTILIFPPPFALLFLFLRYMFKSKKEV